MLAAPVSDPAPPPGWAGEPKVDGHRTVPWRTEDGVRLQSRTGRDVTALWMDLAVAAMRLPPGMVLDGEAVVYVADADGRARISFTTVQSHALSRPRRERELSDQHPATYVAFDVRVLADVGPPIEPVWSTTDRSEALLWYTAIEGTGGEDLVEYVAHVALGAVRGGDVQGAGHLVLVVGGEGPSAASGARVLHGERTEGEGGDGVVCAGNATKPLFGRLTGLLSLASSGESAHRPRTSPADVVVDIAENEDTGGGGDTGHTPQGVFRPRPPAHRLACRWAHSQIPGRTHAMGPPPAPTARTAGGNRRTLVSRRIGYGRSGRDEAPRPCDCGDGVLDRRLVCGTPRPGFQAGAPGRPSTTAAGCKAGGIRRRAG
ncbi:ATP-dependent DNA ligase [Streptomyces sp. NPDC002623]